MSCYHPMRAIVKGVKENGKKDLFILKNPDFNFNVPNVEYINIPCGKCDGCRLDYARQWADRCMLEAKYHDKNCFITLTYNDDNIPIGKTGNYTLVKKDFQDFMKRLRESVGNVKIRYYACGEYGSKSLRPHYHAIIFGYDFSDDRVPLKKNFENDTYYVSKKLDKVWKKGFTMVCDLDYECAAYVARYCNKKLGANKTDYEELGIVPEFTLMSRKPGIARMYYDENVVNILEHQRIYLSTDEGSKMLKIPRYFDRIADEEYPEYMEDVRFKRQYLAKKSNELKLENTSQDYIHMLADAETNFKARTKILKERSCI